MWPGIPLSIKNDDMLKKKRMIICKLNINGSLINKAGLDFNHPAAEKSQCLLRLS